MRNARLFASLVSLVAAAGCGGDGTMSPGPMDMAMPAGDPGNATFQVRESVNQLHVTHAMPGWELNVVDAGGKTVATGTADKLGSFVFRKIPAGAGYTVRTASPATPQYTRALTVLSVDGSLPKSEFYSSQRLLPGFNYIKTRDGTTLSAYVTLPGPVEMGPYPTVVDYSGYDPSKPGEPIAGGKYNALCPQFPSICDAPNDPSGLLASLFGYATVSVNMRGTGCSGGAFDYFETLQTLDGYDLIEVVAAQPWVLHHKVGMVGLSFPGNSQLFVAAARPPGLAAIAPLSVIGNSATTMFPGGMLNNGFATAWIGAVLDHAVPYGQGWEKKRVDGGDTVCAENQLLHGQLVDNVAQARMTKYYDPAIHDSLNPTAFVDKITVPVFLACSFHDEQTGPFFTTLMDRFKNAPVARFSVHNGVHADGYVPALLSEWKAFLDLYVAERVPTIEKAIRDFAPVIFTNVYDSPMHFPPDRWAGFKTVEEARAAYKAEPAVRAIFESGAGDPDLGAPIGTFELGFSKWPPAETQLLRLYFQPDGTLGAAMPADQSAASSFALDPDAGARGILAPGADVNNKLPKYAWKPPAANHAASFVSDALVEDTVLVGTASADLYVKSNVDDADLQVNVTEVRKDGKEMYVQSGWLRASIRGLGPDSTPLWPVPTFLEKDASPLKPGEWTAVRVPIAGFNHVFRAGSRIRIYVDTPGGSRASWRFDLKTWNTPAVHAIGTSAKYPSSVALPRIPNVKVPSPLPPCPSLRGQPCRDYSPYTNTPAN